MKGNRVIPTIDFIEGKVRILDQTLLPGREVMLDIGTLDDLAEAIRSLRIRGAPAIGIAAAYGTLLAIEEQVRDRSPGAAPFLFDHAAGTKPSFAPGMDARGIRAAADHAAEIIGATRPTAVNLFWARERMRRAAEAGDDPGELLRRLGETAFAIHDEELALEERIGSNGAPLVRDGMRVITHCNAGGLATAGLGTALAVLYVAFDRGARFRVYADETRPLLQGARLTAWELERRGIEVTVICDSAAATLVSRGEIDMAIVGADRIARNGDIANKIGTLMLALLCDRFGVPFYVAAPWSTFDLTLSSGSDIPIEERPPEEVAGPSGARTVPDGVPVYNPAFDVTPAGLVTAIITERGIIEKPGRRAIEAMSRNDK